MIEITIRDGRVGREVVADGKGAILGIVQRNSPLDIGETVRLADGSNAVVIGDELTFVDDQQKQTVFVGNMPPKKISIDVGGCSGWTLRKAGPSRATFVRCVTDEEANKIGTAASFCRRYRTSPRTDCYIRPKVWQQTTASVVNPGTRNIVPAAAESALGALVGWILVWRLIIDQACHDLSSRFGKNSPEFARFKTFKSEVFDSCQGYRVIEGLRNAVQHRDMPPMKISHIQQLDPKTRTRVTRTSITMPVSWLLDSPKCPAVVKAEFGQTPDAVLSIPDVVDDAMAGMERVIREFIEINLPTLSGQVLYLRSLFAETAPDVPVMLRLSQRPDQGLDVKMQRLDDLTLLIRESPIGR